ncbi:MAG TPA: hypothetical protein VI136_04875 [Verrucomicrobiae bacterium]
MRIYIESTIPSYVMARPARDLLQAARQQITKDWWDFQRGKHDLFTSQVVLDEIAAGEREMAQRRLELMAGIRTVELPAYRQCHDSWATASVGGTARPRPAGDLHAGGTFR